VPEPMIRRPDEDAAIANPLGGALTFKARGEHTGGRLMAFETIAAPGDGPPLHTHAGEDECLLVLEGDVRFRFGDELEAAPAGSFAYIPRGAPHTWQNVGAGPARMFVLFTPSGMERFFDGFAALDAPGPEAFARMAGTAGMRVVGPPLAQSHPR
jgi:quercetin dioxygenase-like cupin family protein